MEKNNRNEKNMSKEVYVCTRCLIAYDGYIEKCICCGKATTKATKVTKNTITFKGEI